MADFGITATSVQVPAGQNVNLIPGVLGANVTAGQALYYDTSTGLWKLAQANNVATYKLAAIALSGNNSGQTILLAPPGTIIQMTATGAGAGIGLWLSKTNPGGLSPEADLVATNYGVFAGIWLSATQWLFQPVNSNAQR